MERPSVLFRISSVIFRCQKYVKKGTWKWENEFTLRLKKCDGSLHFTLLVPHRYSTDKVVRTYSNHSFENIRDTVFILLELQVEFFYWKMICQISLWLQKVPHHSYFAEIFVIFLKIHTFEITSWRAYLVMLCYVMYSLFKVDA